MAMRMNRDLARHLTEAERVRLALQNIGHEFLKEERSRRDLGRAR